MKVTPKRALIQYRVSTDGQQDNNSLETQLEACTKYCENKNYSVKYTLKEVFTGTKRDRPVIEQIKELAEAKEIDVVVAYSMDRFTRGGAIDFFVLADFLMKHGVDIEFVTEDYGDLNGYGGIIAHVKAQGAKEERDKIVERSRRGRLATAKKGGWNGGVPPFGYNINQGKLVINEEQAEILRNLFNSIDDGMSMGAWCRLMNKQNISNRDGGRWRINTVSIMLRNPSYAGKGHYGKTSKTDKPVPFRYPQIIPDGLFSRVQVRMEANRTKARTIKHTYLLSRLGRCYCGSRLGCRTSKGIGYIFCYGQKENKNKHCYNPSYWKMVPIEEAVWDELEDFLSHYRKNFNTLFLNEYEERIKGDATTILKRAERELTICDEERQRLVTQVQKGVFTDDDVQLNMANIRERREHWLIELDNAKAVQVDTNTIFEEFQEKLKEVKLMLDYGGTWFLSNDKKRRILETLLDEFILYPTGEIELRFKLPVTDKQLTEIVEGSFNMVRLVRRGGKRG